MLFLFCLLSLKDWDIAFPHSTYHNPLDLWKANRNYSFNTQVPLHTPDQIIQVPRPFLCSEWAGASADHIPFLHDTFSSSGSPAPLCFSPSWHVCRFLWILYWSLKSLFPAMTSAMDWIVHHPFQNSYVETLTPSVMVFKGEPLGEKIRFISEVMRMGLVSL